jgi:hypothetical protein
MIDEADEIIGSRYAKSPSNHNEAEQERKSTSETVSTNTEDVTAEGDLAKSGRKVINNTLYALLEGIRSSSPYISVFLSTRLSLAEIDEAILDR